MAISLKNLPWSGQVGLFVALAVAGGGLFYTYVDAPMRADIAAREKKLQAVRLDISKGLSTAKRLGEFQKDVANLETRLTDLSTVLPEEKDAADLLRRLQAVAAQSNLTIRSFKPSAVITRELHAEWPIALELDGSYHNLATFFDRVGKFSRIVNISGLEIKGKSKPEPGSDSTIVATCTATTFVLFDKAKDDGQDAKPGAKAQAAAGKKAA